MVARNDITGDAIQTKTASSAFRDNYDLIFRKDPRVLQDAINEDEAFKDIEKLMQVRVKENEEEFGRCGCGRSPTGKCCGWHGLTEEEYKEALEEYKLQEGH